MELANFPPFFWRVACQDVKRIQPPIFTRSLPEKCRRGLSDSCVVNCPVVLVFVCGTRNPPPPPHTHTNTPTEPGAPCRWTWPTTALMCPTPPTCVRLNSRSNVSRPLGEGRPTCIARAVPGRSSGTGTVSCSTARSVLAKWVSRQVPVCQCTDNYFKQRL